MQSDWPKQVHVPFLALIAIVRRSGIPPLGADVALHVILRAPVIIFPAESPLAMRNPNGRTVERLSLRASSLYVDTQTW